MKTGFQLAADEPDLAAPPADIALRSRQSPVDPSGPIGPDRTTATTAGRRRGRDIAVFLRSRSTGAREVEMTSSVERSAVMSPGRSAQPSTRSLSSVRRRQAGPTRRCASASQWQVGSRAASPTPASSRCSSATACRSTASPGSVPARLSPLPTPAARPRMRSPASAARCVSAMSPAGGRAASDWSAPSG